MNRKIFVALLLCAALCMGIGLSASAQELYNISDAAGLLEAQDLVTLDENARAISEHYECGVYVVIVDDYQRYVRGSIADFSETVYESYRLGLGEGRNGILLALSMAERDYDLCAYGDWAHYAFTDYGKDRLAEEFLDNFRNNDWAGGMYDYVSGCSSLMELAKNGNPLDQMIYEEVPEEPGWDAMELALIILIPSIIAYAACSMFRAQMKTANKQHYAMNYVAQNRSQLRIRSDQFLTRNVVRTRIRSDDDDEGFRPSGGRPGGTTINSGGFSHKSGKF